MNPIASIRCNVLRITQGAMASIANTTQATVSRWESGLAEPSVGQLARIRAYALEKGIPWDDSLFFAAQTSVEGDVGATAIPLAEPAQ